MSSTHLLAFWRRLVRVGHWLSCFCPPHWARISWWSNTHQHTSLLSQWLACQLLSSWTTAIRRHPVDCVPPGSQWLATLRQTSAFPTQESPNRQSRQQLGSRLVEWACLESKKSERKMTFLIKNKCCLLEKIYKKKFKRFFNLINQRKLPAGSLTLNEWFIVISWL